jgi:hypothetical protein
MRVVERKSRLDWHRCRIPVIYPSLSGDSVSYCTSEMLETDSMCNYGLEPLGVSEAVCGPFSAFTEEMSYEYGGSVIYSNEILEWLRDFDRYYTILYSGGCKYRYDSAEEAYLARNGTRRGIESYIEMDDTFRKRGGYMFYTWLLTSFAGAIDFRVAYDVMGTIPQEEWNDIMDKMDSYIVYYYDMSRMYSRLSYLDEKYYGKNCKTEDDCCECEEYGRLGGRTMLEVLEFWMGIIKDSLPIVNEIISRGYDGLVNYEVIRFPLVRQQQELGDLYPMVTQYIEGEEYSLSGLTEYNGMVYIKTSDGDGSVPSSDTSGWENYYLFLFDNGLIPGEGGGIVSGTTESRLDDFRNERTSVDLMGNELPGWFKVDSSSAFVSPDEGAVLLLPYSLGKVANEKLYTSEEFGEVYTGDILYKITVFAKNGSGRRISDHVDELVYDTSDDVDVSDAVDSMNEYVTENPDTTDGNVYCEFNYKCGVIYEYINGRPSIIDESGIVEYKEEAVLSRQTCLYYISPSESFPLVYYRVDRTSEDVLSSDGSHYMKRQVSYFEKKPTTEDLTKKYAAPGFRKEELIGYSGSETVTGNIYIDRGYATVTDRHLRIAEVHSADAVSSYGNGIFSEIKSDNF